MGIIRGQQVLESEVHQAYHASKANEQLMATIISGAKKIECKGVATFIITRDSITCSVTCERTRGRDDVYTVSPTGVKCWPSDIPILGIMASKGAKILIESLPPQSHGLYSPSIHIVANRLHRLELISKDDSFIGGPMTLCYPTMDEITGGTISKALCEDYPDEFFTRRLFNDKRYC